MRWTAVAAVTAGATGLIALVLTAASDPPAADATGAAVLAWTRENRDTLSAGFILSGIAWCALMPAALLGLRERLGGGAAATLGLAAGLVESAAIGASLVAVGALAFASPDLTPALAALLNDLFLVAIAVSAFPTVVSLGAFAVAIRRAGMPVWIAGLAALTAVVHAGSALSIARSGTFAPDGPFEIAPVLAAVWLLSQLALRCCGRRASRRPRSHEGACAGRRWPGSLGTDGGIHVHAPCRHGHVPADRHRGLDAAVGDRTGGDGGGGADCTTRCSPTRSARHGGVRPVEQGEGDSVVAAFSRASDAIAAALDAQRALARRPWPARGRAERADRTAHGRGAAARRGQLLRRRADPLRTAARDRPRRPELLSRAVYDLGRRPALPDGVALVDLGTHRLRDLGRPEQVFELSHPELPGEPPAAALARLRSPNNLPDQLTSVHRARTRARSSLSRRSRATRMLTLTGAGGCGKTRLALQVAAEHARAFPDGAWWVELAAARRSGRRRRRRWPTRSGVRPLPGQTAARRGRSRHLAGRAGARRPRQLRAPARRVRRTPPRRCSRVPPGLTVLATSRAPLGVAGETDWRVPSLSLPQRLSATRAARRRRAVRRRAPVHRARVKVRPNFAVDRTTTLPRSRRSATTSTASRWRSSSRPRACGCCRSSRSPRRSAIASGC